ncbi:Na(+)/H(+) antiporter subunit D [Roseivivax sp. THAF40]|uniref:monovalent cation/H+ antiporter subunit D n=1 Tax=unclassified Roseivivax TaxID=2639302 RepID=UPI001267B830|nr:MULTISPECIES: monovalent cation/H+ antiporter subunit D [unclassified Roseivivax]QFS81756.1 Na(+)/H(+) antiporter subunit D [Roseivivax sp. THAF197b]QFT45556.1 Na(+)/H(+) antiporter subunit D [Roseivivax sp. THAF40]
MTHWIVLPIIIPAMLAAFVILAARYHREIQRVASIAGTLASLAVSIGLFVQASDGTLTLYQLGDWAAPFGIVLVADRLATTMLVLTGILAIAVLLYAIGTNWDKRGRHFHALFQFQLMGINGAFLTGDLFNLFVFFEVLLIASYGLMIHGGGAKRLKAGTQYVLYNLLGSTLFLFALGALYAQTGTLNMADLAERVAMIPAEDNAGIRVAAVLLILVFAIKAAIAPVHFWLPSSYSEAPGPVAALFAIMTKVGAYSILRTYTLIFPPDLELTAGLHGWWLLPVGMIGLMIGMVGVLGAWRMDRLVAFAVIGSMGMVTIAISVFTEAGISAGLYYIVHSTFATAALFLIVDLVLSHRGGAGLRLYASMPLPGNALLAGLFFVSAIAMTGLPPLSGFLGKLLILDATYDSPLVAWAWAIILGSSLIAVVGFARAGTIVFWKSRQIASEMDDPRTEMDNVDSKPRPATTPLPTLPLVAIGGLVALIIAHTAFAGPMTAHFRATSAQLFNPGPYISVVLGTEGKEIKEGGNALGYKKDDYGSSEDGYGASDEAASDEGEGH